MKAVCVAKKSGEGDEAFLVDADLPVPHLEARDLLVEVCAISVNPVDVWERLGRAADGVSPSVIGWDAAGVVLECGAGATMFKPGDRVWYSGSFLRSGSYSALQAVDERLVAHMPRSLDFAEAAALPLTAITAFELLFERMPIECGALDDRSVLLVSGAAGGVGSTVLQLARQFTGLTIVATASRPESAAWVREMGAHHVIDHRGDLRAALAELGVDGVPYAVSLNGSDKNFARIADCLLPYGHLGLIDAPGPMDLRLLMEKNLSAHYENMGMITKMRLEAEYHRHHDILTRIAAWVDAGKIRSTATRHMGTVCADNVMRAHQQIATGTIFGKIVLDRAATAANWAARR